MNDIHLHLNHFLVYDDEQHDDLYHVIVQYVYVMLLDQMVNVDQIQLEVDHQLMKDVFHVLIQNYHYNQLFLIYHQYKQ